MGAWGVHPFQNDRALDYLGGLQTTEKLKGNIEAFLERDDILGNFEVGALILDSLTDSTFIVTNEEKAQLQSAVNNLLKYKLIPSTWDAGSLLHESTDTFISFCALPIQYRLDLAKKVEKLFVLYAKNGRYQEDIDNWVDDCKQPREKEYSAIMKGIIELNRNKTSFKKNVCMYDKETAAKLYAIDQVYNNGCYCEQRYIQVYCKLVPDKSITITRRSPDKSDIFFVKIQGCDVEGILRERVIEHLLNANKLTNDYRNITNQNSILEVIITYTVRKDNKVVGYNIQDKTGKTIFVNKEALKNAIINRKVQVLNYKLTSDGRLIPRERN